MKKSGWLLEEFVTVGAHLVVDGNYKTSVNDTEVGEYTGRFRFEYLDGKQTKWYTRKTAPRWLLSLYESIIQGRETDDKEVMPDTE